jgi:hypothetical protein
MLQTVKSWRDTAKSQTTKQGRGDVRGVIQQTDERKELDSH